jgi:hypothetical protein
MTRGSAPWRCCSDRAEQPPLGEVAPAHCTGIGSAVRSAGLLDLFAVLHLALAEALEEPSLTGDQPLARAVARHTGVAVDLVS